MAIKIVVDAGHNPQAVNAGAEGFGYREQDITYAVAQELAKLLRANGNFEVRLTRNTPEELQLVLVDPKHVEFSIFKNFDLQNQTAVNIFSLKDLVIYSEQKSGILRQIDFSGNHQLPGVTAAFHNNRFFAAVSNFIACNC